MSNGTDTTICTLTVYCTQAHQSVLTILIVIQLSNCFYFSSKPCRDVEYVSYVSSVSMVQKLWSKMREPNRLNIICQLFHISIANYLSFLIFLLGKQHLKRHQLLINNFTKYWRCFIIFTKYWRCLFNLKKLLTTHKEVA